MGVIAVTGSASGIGAATATRLRSAGHEVIGVDRDDADIVADLGTPTGRASAISGVSVRCGGRLDGLVTCAGVGPLPDRSGGLIASVNYFGSAVVLEGLRPVLSAGSTPAVVMMSSNSATISPGWPLPLAEACLAGDETLARKLAEEAGAISAYSATKAAIARLVRRSAVKPEWVGAGIRLNAVAPGMIDTPLVAEGFADPVMAEAYKLFPIPLGHPGTADQVASLICYLLGPEGANFIGSVVLIDGGSEALLRPDDWPVPWEWAHD